MQPRFWENQNFTNIFILALIIAVTKVAVKYITKLRSTADGMERSDHFDCLRVGVDFAFIGLLAGLGVLRVLLRQVQDPMSGANTLNSLMTYQAVFLAVEILLLVCAVLFAGIFFDWNRSYYRGIFVPGVFGVLSLLLSVTLFLALVR